MAGRRRSGGAKPLPSRAGADTMVGEDYGDMALIQAERKKMEKSGLPKPVVNKYMKWAAENVLSTKEESKAKLNQIKKAHAAKK